MIGIIQGQLQREFKQTLYTVRVQTEDLPLPAFVNLTSTVTVGCGTDVQSLLCNRLFMHTSSFVTLAQFPPSPTYWLFH